jgi:BNR/Asp-box repeat
MRRWPAFLGLAALAAVLGPANHEDQHRSPVEIRRFELDVAPTQLVAVGDVLLANGRAGDRPSDDPRVWRALLRSTDLGRTWESLTLPAAAPGVTYVLHGPEEVGGGVAVVVGEVDVDPSAPTLNGRVAYLWTSADGRTWSGGGFVGVSPPTGGNILVRSVDGVLFAAFDNRLHRSTDLGASWTRATVPELPLAAGETAVVSDIWQSNGGRLVTTLVNPQGGGPPMLATGVAPVLVSDDGGATWQLDVCPSKSLGDGSCRRSARADDPGILAGSAAIYGTIRTVGRLQIRRTAGGEQVSTDGGATWHIADLRIGADLADDLLLQPVVPLDAGGWLAVASYVGAGGDFHRDFLLASEDGARWRDLSPGSPCTSEEVQDDPDILRPGVSFSAPLRFDESWLVVHTCDSENTSVQTELLLVDASATEATPVPGTRRDVVRYRSPVAVGDTIVMLEGPDHDGGDVLVQARPSSAARRGR